MKKLLYVLALFCCIISCTHSTEKFAQKEHGKRFDSWKLYYTADDKGNVYSPSLRLSEPEEGSLVEIENIYHWWTGSLIRKDTTMKSAHLDATITNSKDSHDAMYYNNIKFNIGDNAGHFLSSTEHKFIFNAGQKDSIAFTTKASNSFFSPDQTTAYKLIELLCEKRPINIQVSATNSDYINTYSFIITGSPNLKDALSILHNRSVLADKEMKKYQ